jgi:hypothetical protein
MLQSVNQFLRRQISFLLQPSMQMRPHMLRHDADSLRHVPQGRFENVLPALQFFSTVMFRMESSIHPVT